MKHTSEKSRRVSHKSDIKSYVIDEEREQRDGLQKSVLLFCQKKRCEMKGQVDNDAILIFLRKLVLFFLV